ncbi:hypothetical protein CFP56_043318 [Quercus suber]|uniref:DC1 domain-containing protein n=1 Tax=Quercus suber TaxID=58331 RepID=A0AAW0LHM5_QUESU
MRYRCEDFNYSLHKDCMFHKPTITHEIFKNFVFEFYKQPPPLELYGKRTKRYCNACGKHVKGFIYHYPEEDLDLHPCCLNLKKEFQIEIEVWWYDSECGEYNFQVSCITEIIVEELENETTNILALKNLGLPIQRGLNREYDF